MKIECNGYVLEVIKVRSGWAQKATVAGESRYRLYHYKKEAEIGLSEWAGKDVGYFLRDFHHNFNSAEELGIEEAKQ